MLKMIPAIVGLVALAFIVCMVFGPAPRAFATPQRGPGDPYQRPLDNDQLIKAVILDEDWDGESVGADGEAGPAQMKPSTWRQYSSERFPYSGAKWREPEAQRVLRAHASWIRDKMEANNWPETAFTFALVWKAGYSNVKHSTYGKSSRDYAARCQNLYLELTK
jgi:hypothetical protein